jgi:3-dehydroquinate dehydratase/shikimate dehydrogenase
MLAPDKVCAVVAASHAAEMQRQFRRAASLTRTVELRLDYLADGEEIRRFLKWLRANLPRGMTLIATCRRREAGGLFRGTIAEELFYLGQAVSAGCAWYDLAMESAAKCPPELLDVMLGPAKRLASAHFFDRTPGNLDRVAAQLAATGADAIKIAAQCDSLAQGIKLLKFAAQHRHGKEVIAIPMGDVALPLRLLSLRERNGFAYAPVDAAQATAPGQVSLAEMKEVYRADKLARSTRVYGVIGDPIGHSLSPAMQNAAFHARCCDAIYLPFRVRDLRDFIAAVPALGVRGFSVTIPHKEAILKHLDGCDPLARKIGAVNTMVVRGGGKLYGYNTDYVGVLRALEKRIPLRGSRVLILGAGGAGRAVAFALVEAGASVCVCARRPKQAQQLARAVRGEAVERRRVRDEFFDAIVNATPVGMHPATGESPLDARELNCRLVFDTIYRPRKTKLLQLAERRGIETVSGVEMFVAQGAAQWEIWTGERAPAYVMRKTVSLALDAEGKIRTAR